MPAKGTDIVKKLPEAGKKNCRECGFPTCFAMAMKLASGGATPDKCPHLSEEVKAELTDALAAPIRLATIGCGDEALRIGNEEVMYRHEKTFINKPGIGFLVSDTENDATVDAKITRFKEMEFPWVGKTLKPDLMALRCESNNPAKFAGLANNVRGSGISRLVLISENLDALFAARDACKDICPLIYPITAGNVKQAIPRILQNPTPVGVRADSVAELAPITLALKEAGIEDVVLDPGSKTMATAIADQTLIRRAGLKQNFRPLGYPTIAFPCFMTEDRTEELLLAATYVAKYAGIIILSEIDKESILPLLVQRLNIYTDPRIPMSVEEKCYDVAGATEESPVLVTTNWALTYFIVASEVEGSKVPAWLCVKNTDGLGVLTAWAAGKFSGDNIAAFIKKSGIETKVRHRRLVIPGKVARIKSEMEAALPGWEIIIGPQEAADIPAFLPALVRKWKQASTN